MKIDKIIELNLWPDSKKITNKKGIDELENLGYKLFYIGKNADLYTCLDDEPQVLLVRSDRCSVFDIPLNLEIEKKGVAQTAISNFGANFAKKSGLKTAILSQNVDKSLSVYERCQMMELCKPLEASIDAQLVQFELIFRNYLTGSLFEAYQAGNDPYGLNLEKNLKQWHKFEVPIFTPTTKGEKDIPLNSKKIRDIFPDIVSNLEKLFINFTNFTQERGIVIVDTKFEVFINSKNEWVLGDEILTPESSRFITLEDFNQGNYISMDKQILRDFGTKDNWKQKSKNLNSGEKLNVEVPNDIKNQIIDGYAKILNTLNK